MISTSDFKKGLRILLDKDPHVILEFQHVKPGKGGAFIRTKLKNMITNMNLDKTFKSGERFEPCEVTSTDMTYLYKQQTDYFFMHKENFEQYALTQEQLGEKALYLTENLSINALLFDNQIIGVELPAQVNLEIKRSDPGIKGNTATKTLKPATTTTGLNVNVPLHIKEGDRVRVDTRTGKYITKVR